jgi:hypothetical protein
MKWSEFFFVLMPSKLGGIGVFAAIDIKKGVQISDPQFEMRVLKKSEIPSVFHKYCIHKNDEEFFCPPRFDRMQIGWFINHSNEPNVVLRGDTGVLYAAGNNFSISAKHLSLMTCKEIFAGDEILVDYNGLNEPEHLKETYYQELGT